jgi:aminomethyltransferase
MAEGAVAAVAYNGMWLPISFGRDSRVEYDALMHGVVLWDVGCERVLEFAGRDAVALADYLLTRDIASMEVGQCRHALACYEDATILCENLVMRLDNERVWICHGPGDLPTWARAIVQHSDYQVSVREASVSPLAVQGPKALEVMRSLAPDVAELGRFRWARTTIADHDVLVSRTGWSGEFGYEVFAPDHQPAKNVWRAVHQAGEPFGVMVTGVNSTRAWENAINDIHYGDNLELTPLDAGLMRSVDLAKSPGFIGSVDLKRLSEAGATRTPVSLAIDADDLPDHREFWPITRPAASDAAIVGSTWQVFYSFALEQYAANALVDPGITTGDRLEIGTPNGRYSCTVIPRPIAAARPSDPRLRKIDD